MFPELVSSGPLLFSFCQVSTHSSIPTEMDHLDPIDWRVYGCVRDLAWVIRLYMLAKNPISIRPWNGTNALDSLFTAVWVSIDSEETSPYK